MKRFLMLISCCVVYAHGAHADEIKGLRNRNGDIVRRYGVILAGGGGKRLWPLSRKQKPKQFISLSQDKTLLEDTIERINTLASPESLWVVTTQEHEAAVKKFGGTAVSHIINEPASRNTAPAIILTALEIYKQDPEGLIFFVPADHYIPDTSMFVHAMRQAIKHALVYDDIVLLGIQPYRPASEYGYIEYGSLLHNNVYKVTKFHEKPAAEVAQKYLAAGNMLWNAGIFCARASVFIRECEQCAPDLLQGLRDYQDNKRSYESLPECPFDIAVLEKTHNCAVVPGSFKWSDVGNLEQFIVARQDKNKSPELLAYKSLNNLVDGTGKLVVLLDVHDLCVIETDDVLLIARRSETDQVKNILEQLKKSGYDKYL